MRNFKRHCMGYLIFASLVLVGCEVVPDPTPYDLAVQGNAQELKRLLDGGLDVNKPYEPDGQTLLYGAVTGGNSETLKFLIERGADVNFKDNYENTPLIHTANQGQAKLAALLMDHGARVGDVNKASLTAFYLAIDQGNGEIAQLLLDRGARIDFQDKKGNTPLHVVARNGNVSLVKLLLDRKARVSTKNKKGLTPLYVSEELSYRKISALLKKHGARLAKSAAPNPSNLKKWYGKITRKGPLRVRRVIKREGNFRKLVYSNDGMRVAGTLKKYISDGDFPREFDNMEFPVLVDMDGLLNRDVLQSVQVFDTRTWNSLYQLSDKQNSPSADVLSLDGRHLISGGRESTVYVWDLTRGEVVRRFGKEKGNVLDLRKFSNKNYLLVSEQVKFELEDSTGPWDIFYFFFKELTGLADHSLWIFDLDSGEIIQNFSGQKGDVFFAQFTQDGRYVATLGRSFIPTGGMLQNWDIKTGEKLPSPEGVMNIKGLTVFPDSKRLAFTKTNETMIMDLESGKILKRFRVGGHHLGLMDEGRILACIKRKKLILLDSETGDVISEMDFEKEFNKLGEDSISMYSETGEEVSDVDFGEVFGELGYNYGLSEYFMATAVSPQGNTLLATTNHGKMIVFELKGS